MKKRRKSFTLVELLVAVGLLSLIMMLLLQLFSGAQKIWVASEKTNNVYADARVAMELMADILNTTQFSYGEQPKWNMIFSLDTKSTYKVGSKEYDSNSIIFVSKAARELPMNDNTTRFISFRLGKSDDEKTRGKLMMVVYSDKQGDFYDFFPDYNNGARDTALEKLKENMNTVVNSAVNGSANDEGSGSNSESEECQVIAENVVSFKMTAYRLNSGELKKQGDAADINVPPYMIELQLTMLDAASAKRAQELSDVKKTGETQSPRAAFIDRNKRTFTRNVCIGDRWVLEARAQSSSGI